LKLTAAGAFAPLLLGSRGVLAQGRRGRRPAGSWEALRDAVREGPRSAVSLVHGEDRRKNVHDALLAIEEQIVPVLKTRKVVILKPNLVNAFNQLASTHVDAMHGALDFLGPRFDGPIVVAESSAGDTRQGFDHFGYQRLATEHRPREVSLVDLNAEGLYEPFSILNADLHPQPVRLAKRLLDPEAFVICVAPLKTHNAVVATLSLKNMALGAPLRSAPGATPWWSDKRVYHGGVRQTHYDLYLTVERLRPSWGASVIDGYEGMEGNGPSSGTPVASRIALASVDPVAADRVGIEAMGLDASWVGYLTFCGEAGLGNHELERIDVRGARLDDVRRPYQLHRDIDRMLQWRGEMTELPPRLG
jgi:uncharacterized protein (DUF362 family)